MALHSRFLQVPRIVAKLRGHANNDALALDAAGGRLACGGRMNELCFWETRGWESVDGPADAGGSV